jgi:hypothetical protein
MHELKACIAKLLANNFPAYADLDAGWLDGASAEDMMRNNSMFQNKVF